MNLLVASLNERGHAPKATPRAEMEIIEMKTSQLFINIYLHELDWYCKQTLKVCHYLRYADDVIIVSGDKKYLEKLHQSMAFFIAQELHLETHKKVISSVYSGVDVLGLVFFQKYERLRRSTERRKKRRESAALKW